MTITPCSHHNYSLIVNFLSTDKYDIKFGISYFTIAEDCGSMFGMSDLQKLISKRVDELQKQKGARNLDIAEAIGVSPSYVSELKNPDNDARWNATTIERVARFFKIPPYMLMVDTEDPAIGENKTLEVTYSQLPPAIKKAVDMLMFPENFEPLITEEYREQYKKRFKDQVAGENSKIVNEQSPAKKLSPNIEE